MSALPWGRVIVLLSRGPPGEVNVYFCSVCFKRRPTLAEHSADERIGTNWSALLPSSIHLCSLAASYQILLHCTAFQLPAAICGSFLLSSTCLLHLYQTLLKLWALLQTYCRELTGFDCLVFTIVVTHQASRWLTGKPWMGDC